MILQRWSISGQNAELICLYTKNACRKFGENKN
nr:MAG TPA: hypothetical protein [Caudoviricetes sp.]